MEPADVCRSCWNGRETKGDDNSHVTYGKGFRAYQDNGEATTCPPSHPYKIPRLFMEVMVRFEASCTHYGRADTLAQFKITDPEMQWSEAMNPKQPFVLSTGDTTGVSGC